MLCYINLKQAPVVWATLTQVQIRKQPLIRARLWKGWYTFVLFLASSIVIVKKRKLPSISCLSKIYVNPPPPHLQRKLTPIHPLCWYHCYWNNYNSNNKFSSFLILIELLPVYLWFTHNHYNLIFLRSLSQCLQAKISPSLPPLHTKNGFSFVSSDSKAGCSWSTVWSGQCSWCTMGLTIYKRVAPNVLHSILSPLHILCNNLTTKEGINMKHIGAY